MTAAWIALGVIAAYSLVGIVVGAFLKGYFSEEGWSAEARDSAAVFIGLLWVIPCLGGLVGLPIWVVYRLIKSATAPVTRLGEAARYAKARSEAQYETHPPEAGALSEPDLSADDGALSVVR